MREKINENPVYQAAVIGVLVIVFAVVFMTQVAGRGGEEAAAPADAGAAPAFTPPETPEGAIPLQPEGDAGVQLSVPPSDVAFKAGPGLPEDVVSAHEDGETVVLLVRRSNGIDDDRMLDIVEDLDDPNIAVFTTRINNVERYSRITVGLNVDRAPALIVVRPPKFDVGGAASGQPSGSVVYGLQSRQATEQRIRDAIYDGPEDLPYHPS